MKNGFVLLEFALAILIFGVFLTSYMNIKKTMLLQQQKLKEQNKELKTIEAQFAYAMSANLVDIANDSRFVVKNNPDGSKDIYLVNNKQLKELFVNRRN